MADKMLIDSTHPEETRVVVVRGNRVEEFDFESANRKQLRGNIYLAKVTRVEPSLQAAFVDYGGNRHGFLAFSEIHPDYYQIPVADRQALLAEEARAQRDADDDADNRSNRRGRRHRGRGANRRRDVKRSDPLAAEETAHEAAEIPAGETGLGEQSAADTPASAAEMQEPHTDSPHFTAEEQVREAAEIPVKETASGGQAGAAEAAGKADDEAGSEPRDEHDGGNGEAREAAADEGEPAFAGSADEVDHDHGDNGADQENGNGEDHGEEEDAVESVGGADALEEAQERMPRFRRQYKIQEVIKRRQVMLVQVVKEERGTKGAALTTYLSLAGRYSVLMPNTARGGGISRKITSSDDRSRLKEIAQELEVPEGMGVILRTAGASRTKTEVKRDFEYLLRLWETVRDLTLKSMAPTLVYEEGSLVKRSIRDLYSKDIDEVVVAGEEGYKEARDFMRMLMPSHAKNVKLYKDAQPVFTRYGIESQLDAMFSPVVQLRSGGYIVINQAEALVAIDVNSGRATREHHIEDTALKTNCEAAEEVARQLRLRDLAGLIVIDFIDMDESRNNRTVERRMKDALKHDRARIQVGRISHFGLLEMSRQRIRTSVLESSTEKCPACGGTGHVRSVSSVSLQCLRALEEMLLKGATHNLIVRTRSEVALYVLNHKRAHLRDLEERFRVTLTVAADATVTGQTSYIIDRGEQVHSVEAARALAQAAQIAAPLAAEEEPEFEADAEIDADTLAEAAVETGTGTETEGEAGEAREAEGERDGTRRRRRRGRGRGRGRGEPREGGEGAPRSIDETAVAAHAATDEDHGNGASEGDVVDTLGDTHHEAAEGEDAAATDENGDVRRRRRRGRRGGRRNRRGSNGDTPLQGQESADGQENGQKTGQEHSQENGQEHAQGNGRHQGQSEAGEFAGGHEGASERERPQAVEAFDRPAPTEPAYAAEAAQQQPAPFTAEAEFPQRGMQAEAEAPRRRSTIREPAPIKLEGTPPPSPTLPPPQPVISVSSSDEGTQPKRGWWAKRLLGDKG